jgi:solute carrier family 25 protein 16
MSTGATQAQTNARSNNELPSPIMAIDGDAIVYPKKQQEKRANMQDTQAKKVDKKSPEYIFKTLLAGGIAGCAVRYNP